MSTTTLTDRYVWAVTRHLPAEIGPDVARELRGTLDEAVEHKVASGVTLEEAEREAVTELGDPDVLAREYGGRPNHLVGPTMYPDYVRLLKVLLAVVLPIAVAATFLTQLLATDRTLLGLIGGSVSVLVETTVHLVFWTTLVFVLVERGRSDAERDRPLTEWDAGQLTSETPWRRPATGETITEVVFSLVLAGLVAWQFSGVGAHGVQVLDPHLALGWQLLIIGLFVLDAVLAVIAWQVGRWTPAVALASVAANVVAAVVLVGLLYTDRLLTDLPAVLGEQFGLETDWSVSYPLVAGIIVLVCAWDAVSSILRMRRARRAASGPSAQ